MGFTPREIDALSVWEFAACRNGWNIAHGGKENDVPAVAADGFSVEELREMGVEGF